MRPLLESIAIHLKYRFKNERDTIGVNLAALSILQKTIAEIANNDFAGLFNAPDAVTNDPFHQWASHQSFAKNLRAMTALINTMNRNKYIIKHLSYYFLPVNFNYGKSDNENI